MAKKKPAAVVALEAVKPQCQADPNCEEPGVGTGGVCSSHQLQQANVAARAKCEELGLHTVDQMRAWCRKKRTWRTFDDAAPDPDENREIARKVAYGEVTVSREPGDDVEEDL